MPKERKDCNNKCPNTVKKLKMYKLNQRFGVARPGGTIFELE